MTFFPLEQVDRVEGNSVPAVFVPRLVKLWERRRFPVERMMTHYEFDQINEAAHAAEEDARRCLSCTNSARSSSSASFARGK